MTTPVISGFHPDPSVCEHAGIYYLATSSFEYAPGVPLFKSVDLRSWELVGNILSRHDQLDLKAATPSGGIFAPTLRYYDGRFWMITTNWSDQAGQLLVSAEQPQGPWSSAIRMPDVIGIDPDLSWSDEGDCLLTYAGYTDEGQAGVVQSKLDLTAGEILTRPQYIWGGTGMASPEGPHLYKVADWWYLLIAEGGTERGHSVSVARGRTPHGPFESCPGNPILTHRSTSDAVQNTGHADLIQRPDRTWAMVFHGVRVRGGSPQWHVLGRETFAREITWQEGWPVTGDAIEPDGTRGGVFKERFDATTKPLSWVGAGTFIDDILIHEPDGWRIASNGANVFAGRRQEHLYASVRAELAVNGVAGLELRIDPFHAFVVEQSEGVVRAIVQIGAVRHELGHTEAGDRPELNLRVIPAPGIRYSPRTGPDTIEAFVTVNHDHISLGTLDGRYLSTEVAGGMTGRMIGVSCATGSVLIRSFEYAGADESESLFPELPASGGQPLVWG